MAETTKPIPRPPERDRPYWDGALEGKLVLPKCTRCGWMTRRLELVCPKCQNESFVWTELSGRATIYTYAVARQTTTQGFEDDVPFVVVQASIEEQPELCIATNLIGDYDIDALDLGLPLVFTTEERGDVKLPQFRLA
jgi:uncharacterized OB-fold protein